MDGILYSGSHMIAEKQFRSLSWDMFQPAVVAITVIVCEQLSIPDIYARASFVTFEGHYVDNNTLFMEEVLKYECLYNKMSRK